VRRWAGERDQRATRSIAPDLLPFCAPNIATSPTFMGLREYR